MTVPYRTHVELYDRIHELAGKDYRTEASRVAEAVLARNPNAETLLDAACGSGRHLAHFAARFRCSGFDLNEPMIEAARRRVPGSVDLHVGDLRTIELGRRFDAVTCLFSSIGYVRPLEQMRVAVANLARHLDRGGVLVVEPWITPEAWEEDRSFGLEVEEDGDGRLVRMTRSWRTGSTTVFDMHYLWGSPAEIVHTAEHHLVELYTFDQYRTAMEDAGCDAEVDEEGLIGRGLVIGVRR